MSPPAWTTESMHSTSIETLPPASTWAPWRKWVWKAPPQENFALRPPLTPPLMLRSPPAWMTAIPTEPSITTSLVALIWKSSGTLPRITTAPQRSMLPTLKSRSPFTSKRSLTESTPSTSRAQPSCSATRHSGSTGSAPTLLPGVTGGGATGSACPKTSRPAWGGAGNLQSRCPERTLAKVVTWWRSTALRLLSSAWCCAPSGTDQATAGQGVAAVPWQTASTLFSPPASSFSTWVGSSSRSVLLKASPAERTNSIAASAVTLAVRCVRARCTLAVSWSGLTSSSSV